MTQEDYNKIFGKVKSIMSSKIDKQHGMGLSSNNYTTEEKDKLASVEPITTAEIDNLFKGA